MATRSSFATLLIAAFLLVFLSSPMSVAAAEDSWEDKDKYSGSGDEKDEGDYNVKNYPESLSGPRMFPYTSIQLGLNIMQFRDNARVVEIIPGATVKIIDDLSVNADIAFDIVTGGDEVGDDFTFGHFGLGALYTVYNRKPLVVSTGVYFRLINQSMGDTVRADILLNRPYVIVGIEAGRFYFSPYLGVPIYVDLDEGNDDVGYPKRNPFRMIYDASPFGLDYGIPISFRVFESLFITVAPEGETWLYPDDIEPMNIYHVTPGVMYRTGNAMFLIGVRVRIYPEPDEDRGEYRWYPVAQGGLVF